jgi:hypothetical protein
MAKVATISLSFKSKLDGINFQNKNIESGQTARMMMMVAYAKHFQF